MVVDKDNKQSLYMEEFLFFFMGLRKCHCRHMIGRLKRKYPSASARELARRMTNAQAALSFTAGVLARLQSGLSAGNSTLRLVGIAGRTIIISRMHVSLILKIALIFGKDIDDKARVPEILAVIAATVPALIITGSGNNSKSKAVAEETDIVSYATSGAAGAATAYLIGKAAVKYYTRKDKKAENDK